MDQRKTISELLDDAEGMEAALRRGVRAALRQHKALGNPVVFFEEGRTVVVPPEELVIPEEDEPSGRSRSPSPESPER
jgi:hypothetical protein